MSSLAYRLNNEYYQAMPLASFLQEIKTSLNSILNHIQTIPLTDNYTTDAQNILSYGISKRLKWLTCDEITDALYLKQLAGLLMAQEPRLRQCEIVPVSVDKQSVILLVDGEILFQKKWLYWQCHIHRLSVQRGFKVK